MKKNVDRFIVQPLAGANQGRSHRGWEDCLPMGGRWKTKPSR